MGWPCMGQACACQVVGGGQLKGDVFWRHCIFGKWPSFAAQPAFCSTSITRLAVQYGSCLMFTARGSPSSP